jgi:hypothetical protein
MGEHVARMRKKANLYKVFVGKREQQLLLGRPSSRREDNSSKGIGLKAVKWIHVTQRWAVVNRVMNLHHLVINTSFVSVR